VEQRNFYTSASLDRAAHHRLDEDWLRAARHDPASRSVVLWHMQALVEDDDVPTICTPLLADLGELEEPCLTCFLGLVHNTAYFAVDVSCLDEAALDRLGRPRDLREIGPLLGQDDASLLATARGMLHWHATHRHCSSCGAPTEVRRAGHLRVCSNHACGREHFPRTDPAVIMLVTDAEDRCLLGRQSRWPAAVYSTLAGFVEPGESLEDAVRRETFEETGVSLTEVRYHSSQPWPFPASLMIGFYARAADTAIVVDHTELEDARWLSRTQLRQELAEQTIKLPRPDSIARRLILGWLEAG